MLARHSADNDCWRRSELQRLLYVVLFLAALFLLSQQTCSPATTLHTVRSQTSPVAPSPPPIHASTKAPESSHNHGGDHSHSHHAPPNPSHTAARTTAVSPRPANSQLKHTYPSSISITPDPSICNSTTTTRLGKAGEGGWTVCAWSAGQASKLPEPYRTRLTPKDGCVVFSYGIREDSSFDDAVIGSSPCNVHGFDPSLPSDNAYNVPPRKNFHQVGVGPDGDYPPGAAPFAWPGMNYLRDRNSSPWKLQQVSTLMREDRFKRLDILKIDVEGAEWFSLMDLLDPAHPVFREGRIAQYVSEWHFPPEEFVVAGAEGATVTITQTAAYKATDGQPLNPLDLMFALEDAGMRMWTWRYNEGDHHCIEVSYIYVGDS